MQSFAEFQSYYLSDVQVWIKVFTKHWLINTVYTRV